MSTTNEQSSINVAAIEKELTSLWKQASEDEHSGVVRVSILNLLVYVPADSDIGKLDDIMIDVTASHPCRAILIIAEREGERPVLAAQVTSRCTLPTPTSKQVCCEQVTITASESHLDEVPSALAPLLISDLPVYLWWRAVPKRMDKEMFGRLVDLSDRVIIDSALFNDPGGDIVNMAAVLTETPRWTALSDLNWARLTAWRALIAGFYDVADYRPLLDKLSRVTIEYAPPSNDAAAIPARALLLGGWLSSRLGWRLSEPPAKPAGKAQTFDLNADGRKVTMEFVPTRREIEPGRIAMVTLESAANESALFSVRRSGDATRIETAVTLGEARKAQRVLGYEGLGESELIGRELEILGHDRVYEQAVLGAADLVRGR
ncbi:MAG TPA: glucose-6-phosphate dehydrogenase assembly protein OpcA [Blastocatellia bacterium]|nr:glucose-6-phosphate dehydrogenase assembly protein OpcA [Blastocatellia bacterium]